MKKFLLSATMFGGLLLGQGLAHASTPLAVSGGWTMDGCCGGDGDTVNSPLTFTLTGEGVFSITDGTNQYQISEDTDQFTSFDTDTGLLPTYWTPADSLADNSWANAADEHGQVLLGPGSYSVEVDAVAGLWERVDPIPEPTTLTLLGIGLTGLGVIRRRRG